MAHPASVVELPARLGKLTLRETLSKSFFGTWHRARSANTGRSGTHALGTASRESLPPVSGEPRAVRVVQCNASDVIERLALAAMAVRAATHPALFTPLQIIREHGRLGIATREQPGMTLAELADRSAARKEGMPQALALRIALDLLDGLRALEASVSTDESRACLYGGLTPDSIHVGLDGQTRLIDPGVMSAAARESVWSEDRRMLAYSAPELHAQEVRHARHDARMDTFAIGVMLWELLACRSLFLSESAHETIEAVCREKIPRVRRERFVRGEPIMMTVANTIARALERDPARRFQSYDELAAALRDAAPAASTAEVAAFVTAEQAALPLVAFDDTERATAKTARPEHEEATLEVPVADIVTAVDAASDATPRTRRSIVPRLALALAAIALLGLAAWVLRGTDRSAVERPAPKAAAPAMPPAPAPSAPLQAVPAAPPSPAGTPAPGTDSTSTAQPSAAPEDDTTPAAARSAGKPPRKAPAVRRPSKRPFIPDDI